jgi:hypothetical protein
MVSPPKGYRGLWRVLRVALRRGLHRDRSDRARADPQGNPDGELVADTAAHETNEAMTDPEGVGWMDPNAYEVADKCEFGPQRGTPLVRVNLNGASNSTRGAKVAGGTCDSGL